MLHPSNRSEGSKAGSNCRMERWRYITRLRELAAAAGIVWRFAFLDFGILTCLLNMSASIGGPCGRCGVSNFHGHVWHYIVW